MINIDDFKKKTAIVILAYADYESLELALATHSRFSVNKGVPIYILQNGRGSYDCERTYEVAKRYSYLFPRSIFVVDDIKPDLPYRSIKKLLSSKRLTSFEYIIKLDDDVMVLTDDWIDKLCKCYIDGKEKFNERFVYATPLINNNPYGFKKIIDNSEELASDYFSNVAIDHLIGGHADDNYSPYRVVMKNEIYGGGNGTIWRYGFIARWLHRKTTLNPDSYIKLSEKLGYELVDSKERYSINCILFEKNIWDRIDNGRESDEHMFHVYCLENQGMIQADLSIPMIHLSFFIQRNELRDMMDEIRSAYTDFLGLKFPISICSNRLIEIENRLRFMEKNKVKIIQEVKPKKKGSIFSRLYRCYKDNGFLYTIHHIVERIFGFN